jgi:hypothetical protein
MTKSAFESLPASVGQTHIEKSQTAAIPLMLTLIAITMWLPEEAQFSLGSLHMMIVRVPLLLIAPATVFRFAQLLSKDSYRFVWNDVLIPISGVWMIIAPSVAESLDRGLVFGGANALEYCIPYMAIRCYLTQRGQALKYTKTLLYGLSVVGLLALFDWATNEWFTHNLFSKLTGYVKDWANALASRYDYRLGLLRAASTLDHPILLGTVCAFGVLLSTAYHGVSRWFITISCLIGLMAALSSAPIGSLIIGLSLLVYDRAFRNFSARWVVLLSVLLIIIAIIDIGSRNPWAFIFSKICFDPTTADYRLMEWELLWPFVMKAPWFGYGTEQMSLTEDLLPSIDSLWLRNAIFLGLPGMILNILSFLSSTWPKIDTADQKLNITSDEKKLVLALNVVIWVSMFVATTVFYYGVTSILMVMLFGLRASLGNLAVLPFDYDIEGENAESRKR